MRTAGFRGLTLDSPTESGDEVKDLGQLFARTALALQQAVDAEISGSAIAAGGSNDEEVVVLVEEEDLETAAYAGELAADILNAVAGANWPSGFELTSELRSYFDFAAVRALDPNARLIMQAARKLKLPVLNLDQPSSAVGRADHRIPNGLVQVGLGVRQHRFLGAMPAGSDPAALSGIYQRDPLMRRLIQSDILVPKQDLEFPNKTRASRLQRAAQRIGFPVVLKRSAAVMFQHLEANNLAYGPLTDPDQVAIAFACELQNERGAWVEAFVPGSTYRFLIIDDTVVSVVRRVPPQVVGDGESTLRALIETRAASATSFREWRAWRAMIGCDADSLICRLGLPNLTWESVPAKGRNVALRLRGGPYTGGWSEDVTEQMPEAYHQLALRAAHCCELGLAGVDMVIANPASAPEYPHCAVIDVKPDPDLLMHARPRVGPGRDVAQQLLKTFFPTQQIARIPVVAVTGTNGKTTTSRMVAHLLRTAGKITGLACSDGVYVDSERLETGDFAGIWGSLAVYADRRVEAAVLESARGGLIKHGRPFDSCDVGICTNVAEDHIGHDGINSVEAMAAVKRQVIEHTVGTAILNADDPLCVAMAAHFTGTDVVFFSGDPQSPSITGHLDAGSKAVFIHEREQKQTIALFDGVARYRVVDVDAIPATDRGRSRHNVYNSTAAVAAAYALGLPLSVIATGMQEFRMSFDTTPGRFNELPGLPYRLIMDAAHNLHGIRALTHHLDQLTVPGRRILVFSASLRLPADHVRQMAREVARRFDFFICKKYRVREQYHAEVESYDVLRDELLEQQVPPDAIAVIPDPLSAVTLAVEMARPKDLVVVLVPGGDSLRTGTWEHIRRLVHQDKSVQASK